MKPSAFPADEMKPGEIVSYAPERAFPLRQTLRIQKSAAENRQGREPLTLSRIFDCVFSVLGIAVSLPLGALIACAVFLEDGSPVFFGQTRVGKHGKSFEALKFRTMGKNAEEGLGPVQALTRDPRITKVGNLLRKTALDELPQLWNILKGEMSFVGPRPLRPGEILTGASGKHVRLETVPGFRERTRVTPGLTGLAQIFAPRNVHHRHKFRYDLLYIKKRSFLLDLRILFLSFLRTFTGRWEA